MPVVGQRYNVHNLFIVYQIDAPLSLILPIALESIAQDWCGCHGHTLLVAGGVILTCVLKNKKSNEGSEATAIPGLEDLQVSQVANRTVRHTILIEDSVLDDHHWLVDKHRDVRQQILDSFPGDVICNDLAVDGTTSSAVLSGITPAGQYVRTRDEAELGTSNLNIILFICPWLPTGSSPVNSRRASGRQPRATYSQKILYILDWTAPIGMV